ncbi:hypothetical protein RQP46_006136 [Phenoliferia psychrophenolica]
MSTPPQSDLPRQLSNPMDDLEHALASAALDGQDVTAREPLRLAGASSSPVLPPELVADIIDLAVELLVEEERDLPSQALLTNNFLLSAALVDRTWNAIATSALLRNGLIQPEGVDGFINQVEKLGMRETIDRVRFGAGPKGLIIRVGDGTDDKPFHLLLSSLPKVQMLELVGNGLRFLASLLGPHNIQHLTISNATYFDIRLLAGKLAVYGRGPPLAHLTILETQSCPPGPSAGPLPLMIETLGPINEMNIYANERTFKQYLAVLMVRGNLACRDLRSFRLECDDPHLWASFHEVASMVYIRLPFSLPELNYFATYLPALHFFATWGERPSLASLEVLPYVNQQNDPLSSEEAESKLLELVHKLPALKYLKVPACWRSDAVEGLPHRITCPARRHPELLEDGKRVYELDK